MVSQITIDNINNAQSQLNGFFLLHDVSFYLHFRVLFASEYLRPCAGVMNGSNFNTAINKLFVVEMVPCAYVMYAIGARTSMYIHTLF